MDHSHALSSSRSNTSLEIAESGLEPLNENSRAILKQCLWDLPLTAQEFYEIVLGTKHLHYPSRDFCLARLLESVNWFDMVQLIPPKEICQMWNANVKRLVRNPSVIRGMDFACRLLL